MFMLSNQRVISTKTGFPLSLSSQIERLTDTASLSALINEIDRAGQPVIQISGEVSQFVEIFSKLGHAVTDTPGQLLGEPDLKVCVRVVSCVFKIT